MESNTTVADAAQWAGSEKQWTSGSAIGLGGVCVHKKWFIWMYVAETKKPGVMILPSTMKPRKCCFLTHLLKSNSPPSIKIPL
jgi:hypothetical protein